MSKQRKVTLEKATIPLNSQRNSLGGRFPPAACSGSLVPGAGAVCPCEGHAEPLGFLAQQLTAAPCFYSLSSSRWRGVGPAVSQHISGELLASLPGGSGGAELLRQLCRSPKVRFSASYSICVIPAVKLSLGKGLAVQF